MTRLSGANGCGTWMGNEKDSERLGDAASNRQRFYVRN
jgi:hypothetical protein